MLKYIIQHTNNPEVSKHRVQAFKMKSLRRILMISYRVREHETNENVFQYYRPSMIWEATSTAENKEKEVILVRTCL